MDEKTQGILLGIALIILVSGITAYVILSDTWVNDTAVILSKEKGTASSIVYVSDGKSSTPVVSNTPYHHLVTDKGVIEVDEKKYDAFSENTTINITKSMNTGKVCLRD